MTKGKKCAVVFATDARPDDLNRMGYSMRALDRFMTAPHDTFVLTDDKSVRFEGDATVLDPVPALESVGIFGSEWACSRWPFAAVFRLAIPLMQELAGYDRVVYFDTDIMAFSNLDGLFTFDLRDHEVVGAAETPGNRFDDRSQNIISALPPDAVSAMRSWIWGGTPLSYKSYINSGVLLWHPSKIAENGMDWYIQRLSWAWPKLRRGEGFQFIDQDFINYMMDSAALLSDRYNALLIGSVDNAAIVHHVCGTKSLMIEGARKRYGSDPYDPETRVVTQFQTRATSVCVSDLFNHSFVISTPQDEGRRNAFFNNLRDGGVTTDPALLLGVRLGVGRVPAFGLGDLDAGSVRNLGCGLSHLAVICAAKALDWPHVLVFEDDARFAPPCDIRTLENALSKVPVRSELIKLGFSSPQLGAEPRQLRAFPNLVEFDTTWGSHAYVVFKGWYDTAIDILTRSSITADTDVMNLPLVPDRLKPKASGLYHTAVNVFDQRPQDTSPTVRGCVSRPDRSNEELDETAERLSNNWPYFSFGPDGVRYSVGTILRDGNAEEGDFYMNVFCLVRVARALGLRFVGARGGGKTYTIPCGAFDTVAPFTVDAQTPRAADALAQFLDGGDNDTNDKKETQA